MQNAGGEKDPHAIARGAKVHLVIPKPYQHPALDNYYRDFQPEYRGLTVKGKEVVRRWDKATVEDLIRGRVAQIMTCTMEERNMEVEAGMDRFRDRKKGP